jgi:hypothetical protein
VAGILSKMNVKLVSLFMSEMTTTIAGSMGIDEVVLDWLREEPTVSLYAKKRHSAKSGVD